MHKLSLKNLSFPSISASQGLRSSQEKAKAWSWAGLMLLSIFVFSGCDNSTKVRQTFPLDGEEDVRANTQILIRFDTAFGTEDDTSNEHLSQHITVAGSLTPAGYPGTFTVQSYDEALSAAQAVAVLDGSDDDPPSVPTFPLPQDPDEEPPAIDTVVFTLASSEGFKQGEVITVSVSHDLKVAGSFIKSHQFTFQVLVPLPTQGDLSSLRVISTDPRNHRILGTTRPRMAAKFSEAVSRNNLANNVSIRGEISGRHSNLEILFTELSGDNVLEAAARLSTDDRFVPGEWVTVTFNDEIVAASGGENAAHLSPYSFRFQATPGALNLELENGPWASVLNRPTGVTATDIQAADFLPDNDSMEIAVLGKEADGRDVIELYAFLAEQWNRFGQLVLNEADAQVVSIKGIVAGDFVGSDDYETDGTVDLAVILEGTAGSHIRFYTFSLSEAPRENADLRVVLPAYEIDRIYSVDLDSNGHRDLIITHNTNTYTPPEDPDAAQVPDLPGLPSTTSTGPTSTGYLTVLQKRLTTPDLTNIDLSDLDSLIPKLGFELVENPLLLPRRPERVEFGDLDNDGKLDVVVESQVGLHIYRNAGTREDRFQFQFAAEIIAPEGGSTLWRPDTWGLGDIDADRDLDLVGWENSQAHILVNTVFPIPEATDDNPDAADEPRGIIFDSLELQRLNTLDLPRSATESDNPQIRDFDGDSRLDVLVADRDGDFHIFMGGDTGEDDNPFQFERFVPPGGTVSQAAFQSQAAGNLLRSAVIDLDQDRGLDLVLITVPEEDSLIRTSSLETFQSMEVGEVAIGNQFFALGICETENAPQTPIDCAEAQIQTYDGSEFTVPIVGTTQQDAAGYTLSLAYDSDLLSFDGFNLPPNLISGAEISTCFTNNSGDGDCEGFVRIEVTLTTTSQGSQTALSPGVNVYLGEAVFSGREVSSTATATLRLVNNVVVGEDEVVGNLLTVPDGQASSVEPVSILDTMVEAIIHPPLLEMASCEVVEIRESDFVGRVNWDVSEIPGVEIDHFRINVGGILHNNISPDLRTFEFTRSGTGTFSVTVFAYDSNGSRLDLVSCSGGVRIDILRPQVLCVAHADSNEISWNLSTSVDKFIVFKNGEPIRTLAGTAVEYVDRNPSEFGGDLYEVQGIIDVDNGASIEGPKGTCSQGVIGDNDPDVTLAPAGLTMTLRPRSAVTSPNVLELAWINGEGYDTLDLEILREGPAGMEVILTESLNGTVFGYLYEGEHSYGAEPGRYAFRLTGHRGGVSSDTITSANVSVAVPGLENLSFTCDRSGDDSIFLFWTSLWSGYSHLELTASNAETDEVLVQEFLDLSRRSHAFNSLPFANEYEFSIRGVYQGYLPDAIASSGQAQVCSLSLRPALRLSDLETGVGLQKSVVIPIHADLPAKASGFSFTLELPDFVNLSIDLDNPEATVLLNDTLVENNARFDTLEILDGSTEDSRRLSVAVSGTEFTPRENNVIAWVIASIDWQTHGFELWGTHSLSLVNTSSVTFFPAREGEAPFTTVDVAVGDDANSTLFVRKRYLAVDDIAVAADTQGEPEPVTVRVRGTFDNPSNNPDDTEGYRILSYTASVSFNPDELELLPITSEDQSEIVGFGEGILQFPTGEEFEEARDSGEVSLIWLGFDLGVNPEDTQLKFIGHGINMSFAVFKFKPLVSGNVAGRSLSVNFIPETEINGSSVLTTRVPSDLDPLITYFDGSVSVLPLADAPVVSGLDPQMGPITGGAQVTLTGSNLLDEVVENTDLEISLKREDSQGNVVSIPVPYTDILERHEDRIVFVVPPAGEDFYLPSLPAITFDVELKTPGGQSGIEQAFTYENLFLSTVSKTEGVAAGGESMFITGTGIANDAVVSFRVGEGEDSQIFTVTEYLERDPIGRRVEFLTPAMPVPGGSLATIIVDVPELNPRELGIEFRIQSEGVIRSLSPDNGPVTGGTEIVVSVGGFDSLADAQVFVGENEATITDRTGETITIETPSAGEPGVVSVRVIADGDDVILPDAFTYIPVLEPQVVSIEPGVGHLSGGEVVTITLIDFNFGTENYGVRFGEVEAQTIIEGQEPGTIEVTVPPGASNGLVNVEVRRGALIATLENGFRYRNSMITSITPDAGPNGGGTTVTLEVDDFGSFTEAPTVTFDGIEGVVTSFAGIPDTTQATIEVTTPRHCAAGAVDVTVSANGFSHTLSGAYTFDLTGELDLLEVTTPEGFSGCGNDQILIRTSGICDSAVIRLNGEVVPSETVSQVDDFTLEVIADQVAEDVDSLTLEVSLDGVVFVTWETPIPVAPMFIRGDVDGSGELDVTDSGVLASFLNGGLPPISYYDALDVNDDGQIDAGDLTYLNVHLFLGGEAPLAPFPAAGIDPTPEDLLPRCVN